MRVRNLRSYALAVPVEGTEIVVEPGEDAEIPDDIARGLVAQAQTWEQVTKGRKATTAGDGDDQEEV